MVNLAAGEINISLSPQGVVCHKSKTVPGDAWQQSALVDWHSFRRLVCHYLNNMRVISQGAHILGH